MLKTNGCTREVLGRSSSVVVSTVMDGSEPSMPLAREDILPPVTYMVPIIMLSESDDSPHSSNIDGENDNID